MTTKITSVGHSTFKLEIGKQIILTDPWFTTSGMLYRLLARRVYPLAIKPEQISRCDVMLVSHNHLDHFGRDVLKLARGLGTLVAGPESVIRRAKRYGIENCRSLKPAEAFAHSQMRITAVPAFHPLSKDAIGFLVEGEKNIYFSGDTRFDRRIVDALHGKQIDVAILQVSCAFYTLLGGADGMDVNGAAELARAIRPKRVIPMHFDCAGKYLDVPLRKRVSERAYDVENALESLKQRLSQEGIECSVLHAGDVFEL